MLMLEAVCYFIIGKVTNTLIGMEGGLTMCLVIVKTCMLRFRTE